MYTLMKAKTIDQTLTLEHTPVVVSGGLHASFVEFEFCEKWDGFVVTAVFWKNKQNAYHVMLDEANRCEIPREITDDAGTFYFGIFGVNADGVQRTTEAVLYTVKQGAITTDTKPSDPTPDIYTQIMTEFLSFEKEIRAAQEAFQSGMAQAWADYQTSLTQQQTAFEENLTQQQTAYEQSMNAQWETFKEGGDFVMKDDYAQDMAGKAEKDHVHSAEDITSGVLPPERGGTGASSLPELCSSMGSATAPYLAIVGNINLDMLNAALGQNNLEYVHGLGQAFHMYSRFKGETVSTQELKTCDNWEEIDANEAAKSEILESPLLFQFIGNRDYFIPIRKIAADMSHTSTNTPLTTKTLTVTITEDMLSGAAKLICSAAYKSMGGESHLTLNGVQIYGVSSGSTERSAIFLLDLASCGITSPGEYTLVATTRYATAYVKALIFHI